MHFFTLTLLTEPDFLEIHQLEITTGQTFLVFGLFSYIPTLRIPITANLEYLVRQFGQREGIESQSWLVPNNPKPKNEKERMSE
jgi:hypothetical protein